MVSPAQLRDAERLFTLAKEHGFQVVRDDARGRVVKYGTARFLLPLEGEANHVAAQAILDICNTQDYKLRKPPPMPIQVTYQDKDWAVRSQNSAQYELQSLEDGHRIWVGKWETSESMTTYKSNGLDGYTNSEPEVAALAAEIFPEKQPEPEAPKLTVHEASDWDEVSPLAYSRNEIRKQLERTQVRIASEEAKLKPLYDQLAAFQAAYAALSGGIVQATEPRRSVLRPTGRGGRIQAGIAKQRLSLETRQQIRDLLTEGLDAVEICQRLSDDGVQQYHVYSQRKAMAEGGKLARS